MSEYSGADYDAQYADQYEPEISYLTALALQQNGPVLDLCCGTGIVTIPLAETGREENLPAKVPVSNRFSQRIKALHHAQTATT